MRAELISLRSRAEGKQSSERLTTSSLWRNTSTLESLISFSRWGSEWIFSVCFLKTWLSVCLSMRAINRRTVTMSLSPSCRNWLGCYLSWKAAWGDRPETSITWRAVQSQRVGSDSSTQHKVWITAWAPCSYTINSLQFAAGCQIQSVNSAACYHYATLLLNRSNTNSNFHLNIQKLMMFTTITKFDF